MLGAIKFVPASRGTYLERAIDPSRLRRKFQRDLARQIRAHGEEADTSAARDETYAEFCPFPLSSFFSPVYFSTSSLLIDTSVAHAVGRRDDGCVVALAVRSSHEREMGSIHKERTRGRRLTKEKRAYGKGTEGATGGRARVGV